MSPFMIACLCCVLQVSLLGAVGVVLSMLVSRRHAASSATVMSATAAVILVATVFAPIQIPSWSFSVEQATQSNVEIKSPNAKADGVELTDKNTNGVLVDIGALLANIHTVAAPVCSIVEKPSLVARCTTIAFALGIAIGLVRLASAFLAVGRIRRSSELVEGKEADSELKALAASMDCRWSVRVAESSRVDSAAVIGWLRPLIVLPRDWESWSVEQLRAVLAHELAHIVRRDYLWRAVGAIAGTVHFYHPLAHWLLGRLTVSQGSRRRPVGCSDAWQPFEILKSVVTLGTSTGRSAASRADSDADFVEPFDEENRDVANEGTNAKSWLECDCPSSCGRNCDVAGRGNDRAARIGRAKRKRRDKRGCLNREYTENDGRDVQLSADRSSDYW